MEAAQPLPALGRAWLSRYGACCAEEADAAMHPTVLSRVLHALEPQRQQAETAADVGAGAGYGGALPSGPRASPLTAPPAPVAGDVEKVQESAVDAVSLDFSLIWMPLSGWLAALRSITAVLPLRTLSLRDTGLGDAAVRAFCHHMATTTVTPSSTSLLHTLDLSGAALTDAAPLAQLTTACPHLRVLDLADNRLGTREGGLGMLCAALQLHPRLEVLSLRHNGISGARGGLVLTSIAELMVGRSVEEPAGPRDGGATTTTARRPLRGLDLSDNLLGAYYLCHHRDHHAGEEVSHDSVVSFPLVTALFLSNTLVDVNLRGNGLPDALLDLVAARLHVNQRSAGRLRGGGPDAAAFAAGLVASSAVRASLEQRMHSALAGISADAARAPRGGGSASVDVPTPSATLAHASAAADRQWTSTEVADLVTRLVRGIATDLELY